MWCCFVIRYANSQKEESIRISEGSNYKLSCMPISKSDRKLTLINQNKYPLSGQTPNLIHHTLSLGIDSIWHREEQNKSHSIPPSE